MLIVEGEHVPVGKVFYPNVAIQRSIPSMECPERRHSKDFKVGDIVAASGEPSILYSIEQILWSCPPRTGGVAHLKFWGAHPRIKETPAWQTLSARDLKNDTFGIYLDDLTFPPNEMEAVAISAI